MDIITRQEARKNGLKTYYTGQPCKNGHDSYRYVQSGTCAACIRQSNGSTVDPISGPKKEAKAAMVRVLVRCHDSDREHVAAAVWALAVMRWPFLTQGDVDPKLLPKDRSSDVALHAFYCHEEDVGTVRAIADDARKAHKLDMSGVERERRKLDAAANADTAPEWRP